MEEKGKHPEEDFWLVKFSFDEPENQQEKTGDDSDVEADTIDETAQKSQDSAEDKKENAEDEYCEMWISIPGAETQDDENYNANQSEEHRAECCDEEEEERQMLQKSEEESLYDNNLEDLWNDSCVPENYDDKECESIFREENSVVIDWEKDQEDESPTDATTELLNKENLEYVINMLRKRLTKAEHETSEMMEACEEEEGGVLTSEELFRLAAKLKCKEADTEEAKTKERSKGQTTENKTVSKNKVEFSIFETEWKAIEYGHIRCHEDTLYIYNGKSYELASEKDVTDCIKKVLTPEQKRSMASDHFIRACYNLIREEKEIEIEPEELAEEYVSFENCLVKIPEGICIPHTPDILTFYTIHADFIPDEDLSTPVWDKFIADAMGEDEKLAKLMICVLGYLVACPQSKAKAFFLMGIAPNSGKSLLGKFLRKIIGPRNVSNVSAIELAKDFGLASLKNKNSVLNLEMDMPNSPIPAAAVGRIKAITGDDWVNINVKYKQQTDYLLKTKFVFASNHILKLKEADDAFMNRLVFLPFMNGVPLEVQDPDLFNKLWKERSKIITKAVLSLRKLYKNNFKFPGGKKSREIYNRLVGEADVSVEVFVANCCELTGERNDFTTTADLYATYAGNCVEYFLKPMGMSRFSHVLATTYELEEWRPRIKEDGSPKKRQLRGYRGILLKK